MVMPEEILWTFLESRRALHHSKMVSSGRVVGIGWPMRKGLMQEGLRCSELFT